MREITHDLIISGDRSLTRQDLARLGNKVAGGLQQAGLGSGERLALILRNDLPYFIFHEAASYTGIEIVPVNWHLKTPEIEYILLDCQAKAVAIQTDLLTESLSNVLHDIIKIVIPASDEITTAYGLDPCSDKKGPGILFWNDWLDNCPETTIEPNQISPPLFYTSGTSGRPKAVKRGEVPLDIIKKTGERTSYAWGLNAKNIRTVMTGPLYHSAPNGYANMVVQKGGLVILQPRFDAQELLELIDFYSITHLHLVPTMFIRLLSLPDSVKEKYTLSSLIHVTHGAAPCPPEVKDKMIAWWGPVIYEYYAMTETGIITCGSSDEWLAHRGTVGIAAPGVDIEIRNEQGRKCRVEEPGLICVRHEATDKVSYYNAEVKSADLVQDGFLVTGDIGYLDEDNFLYISDRQSEMIISGGVNIYPAEIEGELLSISGVKDCVVFGVPDVDYGEKLVAFIEDDGPVDNESLKSSLKDRIAGYKIPRHFEFVDSLPREDSGKIKKHILKDIFLSNQIEKNQWPKNP